MTIVELLLDSIYRTLRRENELEMAKKLPDDGIQLAKSVVCDIHNIKCVSALVECRSCKGLALKYRDILTNFDAFH